MTARFRVVHFVPDPFSGGRVPIAALVEIGGRVQVAFAESRWEKLLPASARLVARLVRESLAAGATFDGLPRTSGPHAILGEIHQVPRDAHEPMRWVRQAIFGLDEERAPAMRPLQRRQQAGFKLLSDWHIARWVKRRYRPLEDSMQHARVLPEISQYVQGDRGLLLLEPIVTTQPNFSAQLQHVGTSFLAWQHSLETARTAVKPEFFAYIISDGDRDGLAEARSALDGLATTVDVAATGERDRFVSTIRSVGQSSFMN